MFDVADDRRVTPHDPIITDGVDRCRGNIHDDVACAEGKIDARQSLSARRQLAKARRRWNVQRFERRAGNDAGLPQSHTELEALHRFAQCAVPN